MTINEKGYAKLNYSLDVHAGRPDGYHDLTMVMGSVSLWDDVDVTLRRDGRIEAKCSIRGCRGMSGILPCARRACSLTLRATKLSARTSA